MVMLCPNGLVMNFRVKQESGNEAATVWTLSLQNLYSTFKTPKCNYVYLYGI